MYVGTVVLYGIFNFKPTSKAWLNEIKFSSETISYWKSFYLEHRVHIGLSHSVRKMTQIL